MIISLSWPLLFTRTLLYAAVLLASIFLVLLPWSIVSFWYFYNRLIPTPIYEQTFQLNYELRERGPYQIFNAADFFVHLAAVKNDDLFNDPVSEYEFYMSFETNCLSPSKTIVGSRFSILDDTILNEELKPWELNLEHVSLKSQFVNLWPITDNLKRSLQFSSNSNRPHSIDWQWPRSRSFCNEQKPVVDPPSSSWKFWNSHKNTQIEGGGGEVVPGMGIYFVNTQYFTLDCKENHSFLPPLIEKHVAPPELASKLHYSPTHKLHLLSLQPPAQSLVCPTSDYKNILESSRHMKFVLEFNQNQAYLENARLQVVLKYSGLRWYLAQYPTLSFIIGVLLCWTVSSVVCVAVSAFLFSYYKKKMPPIKQDEAMTNLDSLLKSVEH
ncbi:hypothetical protein KL942_000726 [Ogataea angusta]|uniref:Uncharacterized protein n=1 Tax=Pichia angusta TaxID=870730 RepID=A0ABQ7S2J4_PICAN|nr:hypothetical protein KL942_000726 [Ogataea angusta]KAG7852217.1 hypothetical protein KL940_001099 [Ogataea angusta]